MKSNIVEQYEKQKKDSVYNKTLGVIFNGETNLKPLILENFVESSPTTFQCVETYGKFLSGAGFKNPNLIDVNLNNKSFEFQNPNDLLFDIVDDLKIHKGVFINVHYNALFEKVGFQVIPNSLCRLGKADSDNYSGKILVAENGWSKRVKKKDLKVFDNYNPDPMAIAAQVDAAGGWNQYKGQIFYFKLESKYTYSKSPIEKCYIFSDVEAELGLFYNSTVKRGFEDITVIKHSEFKDGKEKQDFIDNVKSVSGNENASSKLLIETDMSNEFNKQKNVEFENIPSNSKPKKFEHFETSSSNFIRKTFQIPPQLIDFIAGKLGGTNEKDLTIAQSIYNTETERPRKKISNLFRELFTNYKSNINPSNDWSIEQYKLLKDGTTNQNHE